MTKFQLKSICFLLFIFLFYGCSTKNSLKDDINYNQKILYLSSSCSYSSSGVENKIIGDLALKYNENYLYEFILNKTVNTLQDKNTYCNQYFYDFDYFKIFENNLEFTNNYINNIGITKTESHYFEIKKLERIIQELEVTYYFYKKWANQYEYKSPYSNDYITNIIGNLKLKDIELRKELLFLAKNKCDTLLASSKNIRTEEEREKLINNLLFIKLKAIEFISKGNQNSEYEVYGEYFEKFKYEDLKKSIEIAPLCNINISNEKIYQGIPISIKNDLYDNKEKNYTTILYANDKSTEYINVSEYKIALNKSGKQSIKLEILDSKIIKNECSKIIDVIPYDSKLNSYYKDMPLSSFESYTNNTFKTMEVIYPKEFIGSIIDSRKVIKFSNYIAFFVRDNLSCIVESNKFDNKLLHCKYYTKDDILPIIEKFKAQSSSILYGQILDYSILEENNSTKIIHFEIIEDNTSDIHKIIALIQNTKTLKIGDKLKFSYIKDEKNKINGIIFQ